MVKIGGLAIIMDSGRASGIYFVKAGLIGVYGIGAMKSLKNFSFADGFITQSHFVNPFYGRFRIGERMNENGEKISEDDIMSELHFIEQDILTIESQSTLSRWIYPSVPEHSIEQRQVYFNPINREILREGM